MKLPVYKAERALQVLTSLDGANKFSSEATWTLAGAMVSLEDALRPSRKARDMKIKELSKGSGRIDPTTQPEEAAAFALFEVENSENMISIESPGFTREMFNLDENKITPVMLAALSPLFAKG